MKKIKVAVVDDDEDTCLFFKEVLDDSDAFDCVGFFSNSTDALQNLPLLKPELVLMDVNLGDSGGIECSRQLKVLIPNIKIIMISGRHDDYSIQNSFGVGAHAYLVKPVTSNQCLATLKYVSASQTPQNLKHIVRDSTFQPKKFFLTSRENEIMKHLARGLLYKEIANEMGISYSAVHKLQHKIFVKLNVSNRTEAILRWQSGIDSKTMRIN